MNRLLAFALLFGLAYLLPQNAHAQQARNKHKTAVAYRENYQRIGSGGTGESSFEIRNGKLWAWGANSSGQLGIGNTTQQNLPVQVGTENYWVAVTGALHTLAIKSNGTLWGWGLNTWARLALAVLSMQIHLRK